MDIDQIQFAQEVTTYKSYAELKVFTRVSKTNWDDTCKVRWETIEQFFKLFGVKFRAIDFLRNRGFSPKERFLFQNFFPQAMTIDECKVKVDLDRLDIEGFKYNYVYLNLETIRHKKEMF